MKATPDAQNMKKALRDIPYKPINEYSIAPVYIIAPTSPKTILPFLTFLLTVCKDFFFLQFSVKFRFKKIEIIDVDHPLDDEVPFVPEKVTIYLDFINFWIRPLSFLQKRIGRKKAALYIRDFLNHLIVCYKNASRFYRFRMSTTRRPLDCKAPHFRMIRLLDPHYLCVPSLHVSIVVLTFTYFRKIFRELGLPEAEQKVLNDELYAGAVAITETVLYIKQHSTNCIPTALYMMRTIIPDLFSLEDAVDFINVLFVQSTDITPETQVIIRERLQVFFEQLVLEGCAESDWLVPMQRWILKYKETGGHPEKAQASKKAASCISPEPEE